MVKKSLMVLLVCLCASFASATIVADSQADWLATGGAQDGLGWAYGLFYPPGGWWGGVTWGYPEDGGSWGAGDGRVGATYMHPHSSDWEIFRGWTSDVTGVVDISGTLASPATVDGVKFVVRLNNVEIWSHVILASEGQINYSITNVPITAGQYFTFGVSGNGSISHDGSSVTAVINQVPEPATISLLSLGLLGLAKRGRK